MGWGGTSQGPISGYGVVRVIEVRQGALGRNVQFKVFQPNTAQNML